MKDTWYWKNRERALISRKRWAEKHPDYWKVLYEKKRGSRKRRSEMRRDFECLGCHGTTVLPLHKLKSRKFCSLVCSRKYQEKRGRYSYTETRKLKVNRGVGHRQKKRRTVRGRVCPTCHRVFWKKIGNRWRKHCSVKCSHSKYSADRRETRKCKLCGIEYEKQKSYQGKKFFCSNACCRKYYRGENNPSWKGGITPINNVIRGSSEYKSWQNSVFNRDGWKCVRCRENRKSKLVAHHVLNFSSYVELRFAIDNGITFCKDCHKAFHLRYGKKNNDSRQVKEFTDLVPVALEGKD